MRKLTKSQSVLIKATLVLLLLAALVGSFSANIHASSDPNPALVFLSPGGILNPSTTVTPSFVLAFAVFNFTLAPNAVGQAAVAGQGHIHVFLDGVYWNVWAVPQGIPFDNLPPGQHTIMLELVNNDHSALSPDVKASATLQVTSAPQGPPALAILSPAGVLNNATTVGPSFVVAFLVKNFVFTDPAGQPKAMNTGHIHVFLDGTYYSLWPSAGSIPFNELKAGSHTIKLQLVNNDHSALSPDASQTITVTVTGAAPAPPSAAIPGFPIEAVLVGAFIWLGALAILYRKRKAKA